MRTDSDIYPAYQDPKHTTHLFALLPTPTPPPTKYAIYDEYVCSQGININCIPNCSRLEYGVY